MCTKDQSSNKDIGICMYEKKGVAKNQKRNTFTCSYFSYHRTKSGPVRNNDLSFSLYITVKLFPEKKLVQLYFVHVFTLCVEKV